MILIFFIPLVVFLIPFILYLVFLQSVFNSISPENRRMSPGNVWLLLIPVFGTVWHFVVVRDMAYCIRDEAASKGIPLNEDKPVYTIGMAMCILSCCAFIPGLNTFAGPAFLVCWIIYWVKLSDYRNQLVRASRVVQQ